MSASSFSLADVHQLKADLVEEFEGACWPDLGATLEGISRLSQALGQRELCLRSQSLLEMVQELESGKLQPVFDRAAELLQELVFHLSHLEWSLDGEGGYQSAVEVPTDLI